MVLLNPGFDVPLSNHELDVLLGDSTTEYREPAANINFDFEVAVVTGAGGSLGRLISLSLLRRGLRVLAWDRTEKGLFNLQLEAAEQDCAARLDVVVGDCGDLSLANDLLRSCRNQVLVHAAAHKHVGLMESCPNEAWRNNVQMTVDLLQCCRAAGLRRFVFLSTDKAVDPIGVMGKTKKEAEFRLLAQPDDKALSVMILRLPNVLGSDGSVAQIFRRQALMGNPLTLKDAAAERIFIRPEQTCWLTEAMLNQNRSGLYLPAATTTLKIIELANRARQLWASEDLPIKIVGLGAGERLSETLAATGESVAETLSSGLCYMKSKHDSIRSS